MTESEHVSGESSTVDDRLTASSVPTARNQIRVLHVDDDSDFVDTVAVFLERGDEEFEVTTAYSAAAALDMLDEQDGFDCIVSDYEMPRMDGLDLLRAVRSRSSMLPFILFTGKGSEEIAGEALGEGATRYLRKEGGTGQLTVLANDIKEAVSKVRAEVNYREIFTSTAEGILILDPATGLVVDANPVACSVLEREFDSLIGHRLGEMGPGGEPFTSEALLTWLEQTLEEGTQRFEWQLVDGTGNLLWVDLQLNETNLGGSERVLALVRDISDRKFREEELKRRENELERARERYRLLVSNVEDYAVCELDSEGYIINWNETAARITGFSEEEAIGTHLSVFYTDEDVDSDLPEQLLNEARQTGRSEDRGWRVRRDGSRFWADVVISALAVENDTPPSFEALTRDLSGIRERDERLAVVQDRYEQLVEQNLVGIYVITGDGFEYVNPRFVEIFGYDSEAAVLDRQPIELVSEEYRSEVSERLRQRLDGEIDEMQYVFEGLRADGETILVEVHGSAIVYDGEPAVMGSIIDVTEREERREELLRYQRIFEAMGDGVYKLDREGCITDCNSAAEAITGYRRDELIGKHVSLVLTDEDIEMCEQGIVELLRSNGERVKRYEIQVKRPDGERIPCDLNMTVLPVGPHGEMRGTVGVLRDISARKERERRYEAIFNQTYQFTGLLDTDGTLREANQTALEFGGLDREDVVGKPMWETGWFAQDEQTRQTLMDMVDRAAGGEFVRCELEVHGPDRLAITDFSIKPVTDENDEVVLLIPEARNITDRVRIERELRESRRKFSTLLSNLPGMAYRCANDREWSMEFVSEGCVRLTGYDRHELESSDVRFGSDIMHPDDREMVWDSVQTAIEDREPFEITYRILTKDGETRWMWEKGEAIFDGDEVEALEGFISDITDRRRMEEELRAGEWSLRELTDEASRVDRTFEEKLPRILRIGCDRLGMQHGHLTRVTEEQDLREIIAASDPLPNLSEGDTASLSETRCARTVQSKGLYCVEDTGDEDGEFRSYVGAPVLVHGDVYGTLCFVDPGPHGPFTDAQRTFVTLMAQWIRFELERDEYERQLERENERLEDFASIVSHDLRNPLDVIAISLELVREDGKPDRLDAIGRATDRMNELIDDLLTMTRQGKVVGETSPVDIGDVARQAWTNVDTRGATLAVDDELGVIAADEPRLLQVFENLFRNAVEHGSTSPQQVEDAVEHGSTSPQQVEDAVEHGSTSPQQVEDAVEHGSTSPQQTRDPDEYDSANARRTEDDPESATDPLMVRVGSLDSQGFFVEDDGPGISKSEREKVFDHGYTTTQSGTGFGLSIVDDICEAHRWQIRVTDSESGGARFEVTEMPPPSVSDVREASEDVEEAREASDEDRGTSEVSDDRP
ncbi:PAS domain S-box protein [Haloarchaeobius sp. TZWWS8]|uniref:sensor histidine kinase n=1 Tax=Haloarchaeobius sp. TZWWS8 TaxID=3446121 RepID=UPI003EC10870